MIEYPNRIRKLSGLTEGPIGSEQRPKPFSFSTVKNLWTRAHISKQMLAAHLDNASDLASRLTATIDATVAWINEQLGISNLSLCDLGCGPSLYTSRFAQRGARTTGVDFSEHAIEYARSQHDSADYLTDDLPHGVDVITLIYCDLCVLAPADRHHLLCRMREMLNPGGRIILDVFGVGALPETTDLTLEENLMHGFWSPAPYVGIQASFLYPDQNLSLDHFVIIEPGETWQVFHWYQDYTARTIEAELQAAGLHIETMAGDPCGAALTPEPNMIGIIRPRCLNWVSLAPGHP